MKPQLEVYVFGFLYTLSYLESLFKLTCNDIV